MPRESTTDLAVLERLLPPSGREVVDVGCGPGVLVRELAQRAASVVGIEVSDAQLEVARAQPVLANARYVVGRAEGLPLADASVDAVIFMRSLHHVAPEQHPATLAECARVLRPGGGLYVAEPLPEGDFFALTSLVEDERDVRAAAQRTLARAGTAGFAHVSTVEYEVASELSGPDALRRRIVGADPGRAPIFDARAQELAAAFARLGEPGAAGTRRFVAPMRADLLVRAV